jgi:hypothetical protein
MSKRYAIMSIFAAVVLTAIVVRFITVNQATDGLLAKVAEETLRAHVDELKKPMPPIFPAAITVTAAEPGCQDTDQDRAKRNIVWRTLNGEVLKDSPEKALALGLLPFVRATDGYALQDGTDRIINRFTAYYGAEQRARMFHTLNTGTADDRIDVIRRILVADRAATNLLECVLRDEGRMQLALSRQPIPLE